MGRDSREKILHRIATGKPVSSSPVARREPQEEWGDLVPEFIRMAELAGSRVLDCNRLELADTLQAHSAEHEEILLADDTIPHPRGKLVAEQPDVRGGDLFLCRSSLAVAENGALWVSDSEIVNRSGLFIVEHCGIILSRQRLVPTMHEAYARLDLSAVGFGVFVAGPSKTADIEQSLVIGAHGPRSLSIFLTD